MCHYYIKVLMTDRFNRGDPLGLNMADTRLTEIAARIDELCARLEARPVVENDPVAVAIMEELDLLFIEAHLHGF